MRSRHARLALFIIMPVALTLAALCVGRYIVTPAGVLRALLGRGGDSVEAYVVLRVRLPRILLALLAGAGLSAAGCCLQSLFANPLASPDTLGASAGASFGAALGLMLSLGLVWTQLLALAFGVAAIALTFLLSRMRRSRGVLMVVLGGVIASAFFNALVSAVKYVADPATKLPEITYWLMGSLAGTYYSDVLYALPLIAAPTAMIFLLRWKLNILVLPENEAESLGVRVRPMRWAFILLCAVSISASVALCGQIGWVGLVIPHLARRLVGANHRYSVPACISLGGSYLVIMDSLARSLTFGEIPVSIFTALIGLPIFVLLFFRKGEDGLEA